MEIRDGGIEWCKPLNVYERVGKVTIFLWELKYGPYLGDAHA